MRYSVCCACLALAMLASPAVAATLTPLASFGGGDGSLAPGDRSYLTIDNTQRGLAYNPATGHLLVVNRSGGLSVNILDAATGDDVGELDLTDVGGAGNGLFAGNMIGVADDGAIYMGNLTTAAGTNGDFRVYRWQNEAAIPTLAFSGAPLADARMGDSLDVFGSGANTRLAAGYHTAPAVAGNNSFAILDTDDGVNFTAAHVSVASDPPAAGDFRLGITFTDTDTVVGRTPAHRNAQVVDVAGATGAYYSTFATEGAGLTPVDFAVVDGSPLLAFVNINNSGVYVYDFSEPYEMIDANPNIAVSIPASHNPNGNGTGQVKFGPITGNTAIIYALDTNNGIQAYELTLAGPPVGNADFDGDLDVDGADFLTWQRFFGGAGDLTQGDADNDGSVTDLDLAIWRDQFGPVAPGASAIPEPGAAVLAALALAAVSSRGRRRGERG
jgi:hypothetical protein